MSGLSRGVSAPTCSESATDDKKNIVHKEIYQEKREDLNSPEPTAREHEGGEKRVLAPFSRKEKETTHLDSGLGSRNATNSCAVLEVQNLHEPKQATFMGRATILKPKRCPSLRPSRSPRPKPPRWVLWMQRGSSIRKVRLRTRKDPSGQQGSTSLAGGPEWRRALGVKMRRRGVSSRARKKSRGLEAATRLGGQIGTESRGAGAASTGELTAEYERQKRRSSGEVVEVKKQETSDSKRFMAGLLYLLRQLPKTL
ncbi:hypothetical protein R3P38DRAFT_2763471 [Favolaschia claudopus]|uniref:Uncharacterized protein n=1 Tax=Favolaschia claudopus TaxID=2862362 RepID=A0AAW0DGA5_9AGAR